MNILNKFNSSNDIKRLSKSELPQLCSELREFIIDNVSKTGGHLASNLGTVELTVALHRVYDSAVDRIVFDVGHQSYAHKIITGRRAAFGTLRCYGGLSGFPKPYEADDDAFIAGHASNSVSVALGMARARTIKGENYSVCAVIGDGALTGGLAYEALNNSGNDNSNLIVVLNDNNMSISKNVGSMAKNLTTIRTSKKYVTFKSKFQHQLARIPKVGTEINRFFTYVNTKIRKLIYKATFFEDLGFRYYGPIDGHDIDALVDVFNAAKAHNHSVLIHVNTVKGKGYYPAEKNPTQFHGIGKFDINTGEPMSSGKNYSACFGETMCNFAKNDARICCVTAAMAEGTGLCKFAEEFPKRFFDVGIAEQHAVTFSSGLAKNGLVPVFAVYSTFLQRSYDQLVHDVAMQNLKVIFAIDRAGFVGADGESHQGVFDTSFLNSVVGLTVFAPSNFSELEAMFYLGIYKTQGAVAIRYPRGNEEIVSVKYDYNHENYTVIGDESNKKCIVSYGREFCESAKAYAELDDVFLIKLNQIKPIDDTGCEHLKKCETVYFYEESIKSGSVGEIFASMLIENDINVHFKHFGIDDEFVKQASVEHQLEHYNLDAKSIIKEVSNG